MCSSDKKIRPRVALSLGVRARYISLLTGVIILRLLVGKPEKKVDGDVGVFVVERRRANDDKNNSEISISRVGVSAASVHIYIYMCVVVVLRRQVWAQSTALGSVIV